MGALEQRLSRCFEPRSPAPDAGLAARLRLTLQLSPTPPLGPPWRWERVPGTAWGLAV